MQTGLPAIVWFRNDLRVADNRALLAAAEGGRSVVCVFVLDDSGPVRAYGAAQRWWLHNSLISLSNRLNGLGARLLLRRGKVDDIIPTVCAETNAGAIYWNRRYDPAGISVDSKMKLALRATGLTVETFDGQLMHEPTKLKTGAGTPFKVYTPLWRAFSAGPEPRVPFPAPSKLIDGSSRIHSDRLEDWNLLPTQTDWAEGMRQEWRPGEDGAHARLASFIDGAMHGYGEARDIPGRVTTSKLSPHLAMGEITPFQVWHASRFAQDAPAYDVEKFRKEVVWREFAYHLLVQFPRLATDNFNASFDAFPWGSIDPALLHAWQRGKTGYPIVDAGMRELWQTGWMHNRVRMICASFLIKHLIIDWREGERWFWDTLVDACPANNAASWQWVAGSGADAAPYYRIFNPVIQGEKFDPEGDYVRRYVPELKHLPAKFLHKPWDAPLLVLKESSVVLGKNYPAPIVDHDKARNRALSAFQSLKGAA